ncbi:MAG: choice-of-anchor H family protein [Gammaproteobacteria bacterium]|nr:choice-of-anchor H family protein [Gammaproteobacteria bacterium]
MKAITLKLISLLLLSISFNGWSSETTSERQSKSIGSLQSEALPDARFALELMTAETQPSLKQHGKRLQPKKQQRNHLLNPQIFHVFDAQVYLEVDDDFDGFYHNFSLTFDADVSFGSAPVYAELYLSYEGGPWNHYFTTEVFQINNSSVFDNYEVVTELTDGYLPGHYDLLIDLYDATWDELVTSYSALDDANLLAIPLEDRSYDSPTFYDTGYSSYSYGSGNLPIGLILLLAALVALRQHQEKTA